MTYTALAIVFMLGCVALGSRGGPRRARPWVAAVLAVAMIVTQFALLTAR